MPFDQERRPGPERGTPGRGTDERAINLPPAILWLIVINVAIQGSRELLSDGFDDRLILQLGLIPARYTTGMGDDWLSLIAAPIAYQFLHGGWVHLGVNMLSLAAFGAPVYSDSADPVVGASGAISGIFGAVLILLRNGGGITSLLPVAGIWIAMNVFFGYFGGTPGAGDQPVAWVAHIAGFVYGLAAIRLFLPRPPQDHG